MRLIPTLNGLPLTLSVRKLIKKRLGVGWSYSRKEFQGTEPTNSEEIVLDIVNTLYGLLCSNGLKVASNIQPSKSAHDRFPEFFFPNQDPQKKFCLLLWTEIHNDSLNFELDLIRYAFIQLIEEGMGNNPDFSDFYQKGEKSMEQIKQENIFVVEKLLTSLKYIERIETRIRDNLDQQIIQEDWENRGCDSEEVHELFQSEFDKFVV